MLDGGEGDDWLFGQDGHDVLRGGAGRDTLDGGPGDDTLAGGAGQDVLDGGPGRDALLGDEDNDLLDGGDDEDVLDGGPGNDDLDGGDADDVLRGGAGDDALVGGDGNDVLTGADGADRLFGRDGDDRLSGGPGDDLVEGGDGRDSLNGDDGKDVLDGGEGDDVARGGAGDDTLKGESGNDALSGEAGNDTLLGSRGDDNLDGGEEHDTLLGGDGQDVLNGGPGEDLLLGGLGADTVRAGPEDDLIVLRAGDIGSGETELIDGGAGQDTLILIGFNQGEPGLPTGDSTLSDPLTGGTYRLFSVEQVQHTHLFTHVGSSEKLAASFVFVNPSAKTASNGQVVFFNSEGAPLAQSIAGGAAQPAFAFTVPPLGRVVFDASGPAQAGRGTAQVFADRPLGGSVQTSLPDFGPLRAGEAPLLDNFIVPVLEEKATGADTGVAIFSSTTGSSVMLTLHRMNGDEVGTQSQGGVEIDIPANGHRIVFVREMFPYVGGDFQGTLRVEGGIDRPQEGGPLAATGIQRGARPGEFTTFPVIPVGLPAAPGMLHFATFPAGGDYRSSIALVNPSPVNRAKGTLTFFDQAGQSWAVAVNGLSAAVTVPYDIGPLGSAVFTTSASGPLRVGSARAATAEGVVGGVLRLVSPTAGTPSAGPSGVFAGFITPAQRNRATGVNTQVALSSTQSPLMLTLVLHDARGAEVPGGRAQLQLGANGGVTQTIDALFPKVDTNDFQGTLTVTADGGTVAATVTQVGGDPGGLAVMPLAPLRD